MFISSRNLFSCGRGHKLWWWKGGAIHSYGGASPWQLCYCPETCLLAGSCHKSWHPPKNVCKEKLSVVRMCREDARASGDWPFQWLCGWIRPSIHFKRTVSLWQLCSQTVEVTANLSDACTFSFICDCQCCIHVVMWLSGWYVDCQCSAVIHWPP